MSRYRNVPQGIDTEKYKYWTLDIKNKNFGWNEDFKTKKEAEERKVEIQRNRSSGYTFTIRKNSSYAKPEFDHK